MRGEPRKVQILSSSVISRTPGGPYLSLQCPGDISRHSHSRDKSNDQGLLPCDSLNHKVSFMEKLCSVSVLV